MYTRAKRNKYNFIQLFNLKVLVFQHSADNFIEYLALENVDINFSWLIYRLICQEEKWFLHRVQGALSRALIEI